MKTLTETATIEAPAGEVFAYVDDIRHVGWHMTDERSMPMMGSTLRLDIVSTRASGLGATYRYSGRVMGLPLDFQEMVTTYAPPREKVWRTIGEPRLVILAGYEMRLLVEPSAPAVSKLTISIAYDLPPQWFWRIVGRVLASMYSRWCLRRMCADTKLALESERVRQQPPAEHARH